MKWYDREYGDDGTIRMYALYSANKVFDLYFGKMPNRVWKIHTRVCYENYCYIMKSYVQFDFIYFVITFGDTFLNDIIDGLIKSNSFNDFKKWFLKYSERQIKEKCDYMIWESKLNEIMYKRVILARFKNK